MHTEETKQKISAGFWKSTRPGKSRIPPKVAAYIKYLYINEPNYVTYIDLSHALRLNPETVRLLLLGVTWKTTLPLPPSPEFKSWASCLHKITHSLEYYSAPTAKRHQMVREQTEKELVELLQSI